MTDKIECARCKQAWTDREGVICPWLCLVCKYEVSKDAVVPRADDKHD